MLVPIHDNVSEASSKHSVDKQLPHLSRPIWHTRLDGSDVQINSTVNCRRKATFVDRAHVTFTDAD
jgi:hypothetical protein